jgi:hypothetical protein
MQPVLRILFFTCFSFCACLSNAQGDEFFQIIHKPKDDAQVKAVFEKSNLKFKYGDTGYTHGDTYVSEAGYSRYYMYAIVDSTVRSITFYHMDGGEAKACPYALPLGITNNMTRAQMQTLFGSANDTLVNSPYTSYTSYVYNYYKGTVKISFTYNSRDTLLSTTLAYVYPYADSYYEDAMKHYAEVVRKNNQKSNPEFELLFVKQTHENVNEPVEMEAGYSYRLWLTYDSATIGGMDATLQSGGKTYPVTISKRNSYYYNGVWCKAGSVTVDFFKKGTAQIAIRFTNRSKAVAVHYWLYRFKTKDSKASEPTATSIEPEPAPVAEFPVGCKVKLVEISKHDVANYYNDEFTVGMTGVVSGTDLKPDGKGWFSGTVYFSNNKSNYFAAAKFEKVK